MGDRTKFIECWKAKQHSMTQLCRIFSISRKTAYKVIARYEEEGLSGLADRSRAPHSSPMKTSKEIERKVLATAKRWPKWGPRKLRAILETQQPGFEWPSKTTIGSILRRHGILAKPKPRRRSITPPAWNRILTAAEIPNDVWTADFKGWAVSGDGKRCEPLAINDLASRYNLLCKLVESTSFECVWPYFETSFREYGLPRVFRSDNGHPFASDGIARLSELNKRLLKLRVRPEQIEPGRPTQNGAHERFNRTLETEAMCPRPKTRELQEAAIRRFRNEYNNVRPHEGLQDRTPAQVYQRSEREYPKVIPEFSYPDNSLRRRVNCNGYVELNGPKFYLGETLAQETVAFEELGDYLWSIRFGPVELALHHELTSITRFYEEMIWVDDDNEHLSVVRPRRGSSLDT